MDLDLSNGVLRGTGGKTVACVYCQDLPHIAAVLDGYRTGEGTLTMKSRGRWKHNTKTNGIYRERFGNCN